MGREALGKRKEMEEVDARTAQAGSPIARFLFDLLADPSSTLRGLLRVSDLFCVRLTCKEAWRCIQHQPLTKLGVWRAAHDWRGHAHHVPLLRWCLHNGIIDLHVESSFCRTIGETGDIDLVSDLLEVVPKTEGVMGELLCGAAGAGHDGLAFKLWNDLLKLPQYDRRWDRFAFKVAAGGCVRTAAVIDNDPTAWVHHLYLAVRNGHQRFVEWVLADMEPTVDDDYVADAAKSGSLELVQWLYAKGHVVGEDALVAAATSGNVELCKWMVDRGLVATQRAMGAAVEEGHVQVLDWLSTVGCRCTSEVLRHAVRTGAVPVVAWCLEHHPHPPDAGDLLTLSCQNEQGSDVFKCLVDQCGFEGSPTELMQAVAEHNRWRQTGRFDAAILVKRYGTPLYSDYLWDAIRHEDLDRLRFALSQGQKVSSECYDVLIASSDAALLNEVLLARKVGDNIPEADQALIRKVLRQVDCHPNAKKVLADHSIVV
jgi:hypothetical protein